MLYVTAAAAELMQVKRLDFDSFHDLSLHVVETDLENIT